ncbi:MAG: WYL domain-containing protein, partial [Acidobacteriaceae bacterium]
LVNKQTAWYLVARTPEGMRTFRVSRMREAVALALTFERPKGFGLARWWQKSTERLREAKERFAATLALSPEAVVSMEPWIAMRPVETRARLSAGWKAYAVEFDSAYAARFVTLGLGSGARVLAPEGLRKEVAAELRKMRGPTLIAPTPGAIKDGAPRVVGSAKP